MKSVIISIGLLAAISFTNNAIQATKPSNINTYFVYLGNTLLLSSYKQIDTATISFSQINTDDKLIANRNLCGHFGESAPCTLSLFKSDSLLAERTLDSGFGFYASIHLKPLMMQRHIQENDVLEVRFTIHSDFIQYNIPIRLCYLKFRP